MKLNTLSYTEYVGGEFLWKKNMEEAIFSRAKHIGTDYTDMFKSCELGL